MDRVSHLEKEESKFNLFGTPVYVWLPGAALVITVGGFVYGVAGMISGRKNSQGTGMRVRVFSQLVAVGLLGYTYKHQRDLEIERKKELYHEQLKQKNYNLEHGVKEWDVQATIKQNQNHNRS